MDRDKDEELLRGRVYGTDFDDPHPGPRTGIALSCSSPSQARQGFR
ncbi:hypothetical protein [Streptomyces chrestomyceticus]|nr:hypothetical protein [Streptomyces chrestomyceticus]